jgi:hypothetical protein
MQQQETMRFARSTKTAKQWQRYTLVWALNYEASHHETLFDKEKRKKGSNRVKNSYEHSTLSTCILEIIHMPSKEYDQ